MAEKINDGGPAFPMRLEDQGNGCGGMSLRDWFAGKALEGILAGRKMPYEVDKSGEYSFSSYAIADAMLKAREAKP